MTLISLKRKSSSSHTLYSPKKPSEMERSALLGVGIFVVMGAFVLAGRSMLPSKTVENMLLAQRELYPLETSRSLQQTQYDTSTAVVLPGFTNVFQDVWEPVLVSDVPFFWDLPKAGTLTFQSIAAECLGLTSASSRGIPLGDVSIQSIAKGKSDKPVNPKETSLTPSHFTVLDFGCQYPCC